MNEYLQRVKPFSPYLGSEDSFQTSVARYLDSLKLLWFHCPNGGSRNKIEGAKLKGMGVKKGVSDVIICEPRLQYSGMIIELKVGRNKVSPEQLEFLDNMKARGWRTLISYSLDEVMQEVDQYISCKTPIK